MANYIDEEILCEGYTHLDIDTFKDKAALEKLKRDMVAYMQERARFLLGDEVKVIVEFEEGSLKTTVKVVGKAALVIAIAIGDWGTFRSGVKQAAEDATMLAQASNLELIFRTRAQYCDRVRIENRKGVLGRVVALLGQLDQSKINLSKNDIPSTTNAVKEFNAELSKLLEWEKNIEKLFEKITNEDTKTCIAAGFAEELEQFPEDVPWAQQLTSKGFRAAVAQSDTKRAAQLASIAAAYKTTINSLKKNLMSYLPKQGRAKA